MQSELDWMGQDEAAQEAYRYFMRSDPEMRNMLGPIETVEDEVTGRSMRRRAAKVALLRGSSKLIETTVYLDPLPHIRLDKPKDLQGWYSAKNDGSKPGNRERDRPCMTDAILTQPYGGTCPANCMFCYINAGGRGYRGTGLATVPVNYGEYVRQALAKMTVGQAGYFTSFHDPFNPLEEFYHNTQAGAEAFVEAGLPIFFLSRFSYPGWAYDLLQRNPYSYMQKSINTPDPEDWKKLSPGAIPLEQTIDEIREARKRGIYVSIQCNPVVAGIVTHEDIEQLFELLAAAGANHVIVKFVEANHPWAGALTERLAKRFGDNRASAFKQLFVEKQAGQQTTITEEYRREGHTRYRKKATELGMTYSLCYEYTRRPDGRWVSMGPEFITSEQCHGHAVPWHTKQPTGKFAPLGVCAPGGCLTCADDNAGKPRCGSELLGAAGSLRMSDFKKDPGFSKKALASVGK